MAQVWAKQFYDSKEWEAVRNYVMLRDHFCCRKCGMPAKEVHHKIHLSPENIWDPKITLNPDNLVALCRDCHFMQHAIDDGRCSSGEGFHFDATGQLVPDK